MPLTRMRISCSILSQFYCKMTGTLELRRRVQERLGEQRRLVASLLQQREQLGGSLFQRWAECGKAGCACRTRRRHGPYYVLSLKRAGASSFTYLDGKQVGEARTLLGRHREFRRGLQKLQKLNVELVSLLRRYQASVAKGSGKKLVRPAAERPR